MYVQHADKQTQGSRVYISMMYIVGECLSNMSQSLRGARGPGRPALKRYIRGRQSGNLKSLALKLNDASSAPDSQLDPPDPDSTLTPDEQLRVSLLTRSTGVLPVTSLPLTSIGLNPLFLDSISRPSPDWHLREKILTIDLPEWFDIQVSSAVIL